MSPFSSLLITIRHASKNQLSSLINICGLAVGLAAFTAIMLYVEHELSFDRFHSRHDDTYRIVKDFVTSDGTAIPDATTPPALAKAMRTQLPDVESVTRFVPARGRLFLVQREDKRHYETSLINVDKEFFKVFDFEFISGNRETSLDQIHSMILTESTARKYFDKEDPIGRTIKMNINGGTEYVVTGVLKDVPSNSHFKFNIIIPLESRRDPDADWQRSFFYTYVRLKSGADPNSLLSGVRDLVKANLPNTLDRYHLQALTDIHLHSNLKMELSANGDISYMRILVLVGLFILVIACINYVNLVTARSSDRAKEIGVRKVVGALRFQLVRQFLTESALTLTVALVIAIAIVTALLPSMGTITGVDLSNTLFESGVLKWIFPFVLIISLLAGFYPAIYLSGVQPLKTLRGKFSASAGGGGMRKTLVVFQFAMSTALIAGTLIVSSQLRYMKRKDMGFNKDNVLLVPNVRGGIGEQSAVSGSWDNVVKEVPGVVSFARADGVLGSTNSVNGVESQQGERISLNFIRIDHDFIPTLEIELTEGRNFSPEFISDSTAIILNEEAVRQLGLQDPVIGQKISWDDEAGKMHDVTIVGITRDFHFNDLRKSISPFGFILEVNNGSNFFIRTSGDLKATLEGIAKVWNLYNPGKPFDYTFQDQYIANLHAGDGRFEKLFSVFTTIAILIACLGLFGLTAFLAESRTKEIGVRKVLGASVSSILRLLSTEYVIMIVVAFTLAFPIAWLLMSYWLKQFAYHIDIGWQIFALAGLSSIVLAIITISFHALKVATRNPVHSLRAE